MARDRWLDPDALWNRYRGMADLWHFRKKDSRFASSFDWDPGNRKCVLFRVLVCAGQGTRFVAKPAVYLASAFSLLPCWRGGLDPFWRGFKRGGSCRERACVVF